MVILIRKTLRQPTTSKSPFETPCLHDFWIVSGMLLFSKRPVRDFPMKFSLSENEGLLEGNQGFRGLIFLCRMSFVKI